MQVTEWGAAIRESALELVRSAITFLPNIATALVLAVAGWLMGRFLRALTGKAIQLMLARLSTRAAIQRGLERSGIHQSIPGLVGNIVFWGVWLFFLAAAVDHLNLRFVSGLLGQLVYYAPKVVVALFILFLGFLGGGLAREWVTESLSRAGMAYAPALGGLAQTSTVLISVLIAVDQVGIESAFLMIVLAIVAGAVFGGMALAFGLGSGPLVTNIVSSYYIRKTHQPGQRLRLGATEGTIREITPTAVIVDSADGEVIIPARRFQEEMSIRPAGGKTA